MNSEVANGTSSSAGLSREQTSCVIRILESYLGSLERGCPPDPDELVNQHPEMADVLRAYLDKLALLHQAAAGLRGPTEAEDAAPAALLPARGRLGDFRIIREVGRGGMGVVYEAEQISLGRRVALKVIPFASALDSKQLARFKKEAQAAAHLHHTHIVPVYATGADRGVHYYAMQYIEGQTLAAMISELRHLAGLMPADATAQARNRSEANGAKTMLRSLPNKTITPNGKSASADSQAQNGTKQNATFVTRRSTKNPAFFRTAARLGVQAAEALEHAHQMGVVHRDIKPANLLVDARSHVWITDFGLAIYQSENGLTLTGDLLGTLRYMSPEQAMAKRFLVDHRTDVYSLGITLYELVTLEPAYNGKDRQELLKQIAFEEPRPPRQVNPAVPVELETIILKAMAKELDERYASAQDLADDLRRFLENKPILAKRPTIRERMTKWAKRHRAVVATAVGLFILALGALVAFTILLAREQARTKAEQARTMAALEQMRQKEAEAQAMRFRAESNFQRACMGVTQPLLKLQDKEWDQVPSIHALRRALATQSVKFLQGFLNENSNDPAVRLESARVYFVMATVHRLRGEFSQTKDSYIKAIRLYEKLSAEFPEDPNYRRGLALAHSLMGVVLHETGHAKEARAEFSRSVEYYRLAMEDGVDSTALNDFAWLRATCPVTEFRDAREAVALAKQALQAVPPCDTCKDQRGIVCNTLGVAYYRAGNWQAAIDTLNRSMELRSGGDGNDWYFLAMAFYKLGDEKRAHLWYEKAVKDNQTASLPLETLTNFRSEAEDLLGIRTPQSKPKASGVVSQ